MNENKNINVTDPKQWISILKIRIFTLYILIGMVILLPITLFMSAVSVFSSNGSLFSLLIAMPLAFLLKPFIWLLLALLLVLSIQNLFQVKKALRYNKEIQNTVLKNKAKHLKILSLTIVIIEFFLIFLKLLS